MAHGQLNAMFSQAASDAIKSRLRGVYGNRFPGWTYYVTRNGQPYADASDGFARLPGAAGGEARYDGQSLVHVASVSKLICLVGVLRLVEDWNEIFGQTTPGGTHRTYHGPARPGDEHLIESVLAFGYALSLDTKFFPLLFKLLDLRKVVLHPPYPNPYIAAVTLRELLDHKSGLNGGYDQNAAALGYDVARDIKVEVPWGMPFNPPPNWPVKFNLSRDITVVCRTNHGVTPPPYSNHGYTLLGAVIQALTGVPYEQWIHRRVFPDATFADISRRVVDLARSALYYHFDPGSASFGGGVYHPDYASFSAAGGWYVSASALCAWTDAVMRQTQFHGRPILRDVSPLRHDRLGLEYLQVGPLRGFAKNGGTTVSGGGTNAKVGYLEGYGSERLCVFAQVNCDAQALPRFTGWNSYGGGIEPLFEDGLVALRPFVYLPLVHRLESVNFRTQGLNQHWYWDQSGTVGRAAALVAPVVQQNRTNLFGQDAPAVGRTAGDVSTVEFTGFLDLAEAGPYRFRLSSDDGSVLLLGGLVVVDNDFDHALRAKESSLIYLARGMNELRLLWYNGGGGGSLYLEWMPPRHPGYSPVPVNVFHARKSPFVPLPHFPS